MKPFPFPDRESLLAEAARLGLDLPWSADVGPLLDPLEVAGRRFANRLVVQPMEGCDGKRSGAPGERTFRRYRRFAAGGSGLIWFEATAVRPDGRANPRQLCLVPENQAVFARLAAETRQAARDALGAACMPVLILQLTHSGRYRRPGDGSPPLIAHHNPDLDRAMGLPADYELVSDADLERLQADYVAAAERARAAGFDGVDVKACHGYLVSELLAAHTRENSRYGGPFENRTRFLREVITRIRERLPDLLVACRLNAWDGFPQPFGFGADPAGEPDDAVRLVRLLRTQGCPLLNVTVGNPYFNPHFGRPFDEPLVGGAAAPEHPLVGVSRLLRLTARLQRAVPGVPLVGTGYSWLRHHFPHVGAAVLKEGGAGFIGVGRNAFACPDFPRKLADRGYLDPDEVCITCSRCSQIMRDGGQSGCVVHDGAVYLPEFRAGRRRVRGARTNQED